jgi:tetraacyldisaccharide 4'-kinase
MSARRLLLPLSPAYRVALAIREFRLRRGWEPVRRLGFPVVSIGNLSTGGAGKTPFAIALAKALCARGFGVDVLSRGYGRKRDDAARVVASGSVDQFGDEPVLIAREAGVPVYVAPERYDAGRFAEKSSPDTERLRVHILDDAFQHRQLHRDLDILLLNREDWQDRLLPAGNLREPVDAARRADVIAIPEDEAGLEKELRAWGWTGQVWRLRRSMEVPQVDGPVVAFCGIARPEQFFAGLEAAGLRIAARIAFRDHHRYTARDVERLRGSAKGAGVSSFVTTLKDEIRLESLNPGSWSPTFATKDVAKMGHGRSVVGKGFRFYAAGLRIEIQDEEAALGWLARRLSDTGIRPAL